jgi:integrase
MASLRRVPRSPYWVGSIRLPNGRRTTRSTKITDRAVAQRMVDGWQAAADAARAGWQIQRQAQSVLNDILALAGQAPAPRENLAGFLGRWLEGRPNVGTRHRYQRVVDLFLDYAADRSIEFLGTVTYEHVLEFGQELQAAGVASKTLLIELRVLGAAFNLARKLDLVSRNPVEKALALRPIRAESSRREPFSPEQVRTLLTSAEGDWKTMILLGFYTGARLRDCATLLWSNVDLAAGVISFRPQKTRGRPVIVPIHPELGRWLQELRQSSTGQEALCPSLCAKGSGGKGGLSAQFRQLMDRAGVDAGTGAGQGLRPFSRWSFHSLRHAFNSALANAGVPQEARMALTGHRTPVINDGYTRFGPERLRDAISRLPSCQLQ